MTELNEKIRKACIEKVEWYKSAGFVIKGSKLELLGFGCDPDPIIVGDCEVKPKSKIKFLGLNISSDLTWKDQVQSVCQKMRFTANRIRSEGCFFDIPDKTRLFNGWAKSLLFANASAFLPFIPKSLIDDLQTALNSERAISNPNRGFQKLA